MDLSKTPSPADSVTQALGEARRVRETLVGFIDKIKEQTPDGRPPWAILCAPELLQHFVTVLAFEHGNKVIARADTKVSGEEITTFLDEHSSAFGRNAVPYRKPAMFCDLFGVRFISAAGIPPGSLVFVPAAEPEKVIISDGTPAASVGPSNA